MVLSWLEGKGLLTGSFFSKDFETRPHQSEKVGPSYKVDEQLIFLLLVFAFSELRDCLPGTDAAVDTAVIACSVASEVTNWRCRREIQYYSGSQLLFILATLFSNLQHIYDPQISAVPEIILPSTLTNRRKRNSSI